MPELSAPEITDQHGNLGQFHLPDFGVSDKDCETALSSAIVASGVLLSTIERRISKMQSTSGISEACQTYSPRPDSLLLSPFGSIKR